MNIDEKIKKYYGIVCEIKNKTTTNIVEYTQNCMLLDQIKGKIDLLILSRLLEIVPEECQKQLPAVKPKIGIGLTDEVQKNMSQNIISRIFDLYNIKAGVLMHWDRMSGNKTYYIVTIVLPYSFFVIQIAKETGNIIYKPHYYNPYDKPLITTPLTQDNIWKTEQKWGIRIKTSETTIYDYAIKDYNKDRFDVLIQTIDNTIDL